MKITGAAASKKYSFQQCVDIARAVNAQVVSIGSALDHCHVPGRQKHETLPRDLVVVGAGIHNEPGAQRISPFPTVEELIGRCLTLLCDPNDAERAFVKFNPDDEVVLVVNNYGGLSNLELGALTDEIIIQLASQWNIKPARILSGIFETSLNAPGFAISLGNITAAAKESNTKPAELLDLLDLKTEAVWWPNITRPQKQGGAAQTAQVSVSDERPKLSPENDIKSKSHRVQRHHSVTSANMEKFQSTPPCLTPSSVPDARQPLPPSRI
jgi:triose/dihydroxyacetone kinase / FAD-AMP lyase (cyclizing)